MDEPTTLPEGEEVELVKLQDVPLSDEHDGLTDGERSELDRRLRESVEAVERGELVDGLEVLARLKASNEAFLRDQSRSRDRKRK